MLLSKLSKRVGTVGGTWNLLNYDGELFTASQTTTPILSIIGGLNGGMDSANNQFATAQLYSLPDASQPAVTETESLTALTATIVTRTQEFNTVQIFRATIDLSYKKLSGAGRLSGIHTVGDRNPVANENAWQILQHLRKIARDFNYTIYNGVYNASSSVTTADKTRGMFAVTEANQVVDAEGALLSRPLMNQIFLDMHNAGAEFENIIIFCAGFQKQMLSEIYLNGKEPMSRTVGGVNVQTIITDFAEVNIAVDRMVPAAKLGIFDVSVMAPVFQPVPEKGRLFVEPLAKVGASEKSQLYGQMGLDHGPPFMHGSIKNLKTFK